MHPRANTLKAIVLGADWRSRLALNTGKPLRAFLAIFCAAIALALFSPQALRAQADLGSIGGTVTDVTGAVVAGAKVTVTNNETGAQRVSVTNSTGGYSVNQLNPGSYQVSITASGFATAIQKVQVTVGSQNTVSVKLAVASEKTEITVSADNFAGVQLEKAEISTVIDTDQIQSLPTLDRNPYNLVAFSGNLSADPTAQSRGVGFNISGARSTSVDILLDGAENTDVFAVGVGQTVPLDATAEIRIVTSNSGAEYGRGSGAVNVSTKSGTNGFHGSAYEFNRISTLASAGYNNNYIHAMEPDVPAKPRYTHNQFGYSIGGPVKKDHIFFFSSTEWTRIRSAQNIIAVVPTQAFINMAAKETQDFFGAYGKLAHPINGQTFTGSDPAVQNVFASDIASIAETHPDVLTTPIFGQSIFQVPQDSGGGAPVNQWITFNRGDFTFNQNTSMFVRYIQQSSVYPDGYNNASPYDGYNTGVTQFNRNLELSLSHAFSPSLASATKLLGARFNQQQPLGKAPVSPTLYINGGSPVTLGGGLINFPGYSQTSPGNAIPFGGPQNFIQAGEDLAWTHGKHGFTFGGNYLYIKDNRVFGAYENAVDGLVQTGTKHALENFIAGGMGFLNVAVDPKGAYPCKRDETGAYQNTPECQIELPAVSPNFSRSNRYHDGAVYFNDSWKVNPKLTLNLGVRWEGYGPQHSQRPEYDSNFFMGPGNTPWDQIRNGEIKTRKTSPDGRLWNFNKNQYGPKVGFAYDPFGNGKTSIRGGYSISYERNFNNVTFNVIQNPPNYAVVAFTSADNNGALIPISTNNFSTFGSGTGLKQLPNVTLRAVDPKIKPAYASNWSLSVERQIASTTGSLSYVGTRGIHNYSIANINRTADGHVYEGDARAANRTNYQYSSINWRGADGDSYYNGLTAELRSQNLFQSGLTARVDYTWSHSIDNTSSAFSDSGNVGGGGLVLGYTDPWNHALDRGSSDFDQKQRAAVALVWALPYGKTMSGAAKALLADWTLSATFDAQTGTPFSEFDCGFALTVCVRAGFASEPLRKKRGGMTDISSTLGPNTYSYLHLPDYYNPSGDINLANYTEQVNPDVGASDVPICAGIHGAGCHLNPGMDGRNAFRGPGSWHQNLGVIKDFKIRERYNLQFKGEFINLMNHANTGLNLNGANDVSSYTDVLAYKDGNRNTELSLHFQF
ncbi:TonB-dependent receptor [Occallatibacter riparius]|uniref:TonB-dependent receptor n=1 Tax=Occallatibacter riparius TaxID=1002689 RepID=A0A9J7BS82_9BACT|nr:TonB-dependent receptor [Occallatibacter riparius]UWZ85740.1 TonB-dependent receptor [Occallatibacter riparius]